MLPNSYQCKLNWDNLFLYLYKVSIYEIAISYIRVDLNQKKKYIVLSQVLILGMNVVVFSIQQVFQ